MGGKGKEGKVKKEREGRGREGKGRNEREGMPLFSEPTWQLCTFFVNYSSSL